jgi:hypothetical protein
MGLPSHRLLLALCFLCRWGAGPAWPGWHPGSSHYAPVCHCRVGPTCQGLLPAESREARDPVDARLTTNLCVYTGVLGLCGHNHLRACRHRLYIWSRTLCSLNRPHRWPYTRCRNRAAQAECRQRRPPVFDTTWRPSADREFRRGLGIPCGESLDEIHHRARRNSSSLP